MVFTGVETGTLSKKETGFTASLKWFWRRGRERFIDPALIGAGVVGAAILVGVGTHFFISSALGVSAEALRQDYVSFVPTALEGLAAGGIVGGIAGIIREHRRNEDQVRKLTEDSLFGLGGK